jgi:predicted amidophosphoribosyltransferase
MKMHPSVTIDRIIEAVERRDTSLDNPGICIACGADADGCEPDAENYVCESCEEPQVFGAEQLLIMVG